MGSQGVGVRGDGGGGLLGNSTHVSLSHPSKCHLK